MLFSSFAAMKSRSLYVLIMVFVFHITSSQPTYDFDEEDSDCAGQRDLEMLRNRVVRLEEIVASVLVNANTTTVEIATSLPSISPASK